jgi:hypothetical protein
MWPLDPLTPEGSGEEGTLALDRHRRIGWTWIALAMVSGLILGSFAFGGPLPAPKRFADYAGLPRRLLRLSHISLLALGALNLLYAREAVDLEAGLARRIGGLLLWGSVLLPLTLALGAFIPETRLLAGIPAVLLTVGAVSMAFAVGRPAAKPASERRAVASAHRSLPREKSEVAS